LGDPIIDEQLLSGAIPDILRRMDEKLISHNRTAVDFTSGLIEQRRSSYPLAALQQLVRNAVLHRTYEATHAPVRVYWCDDRIEITNPGGPYGIVTAGNFGEPGLTDYRNPNLAEALRTLGFVQHFGAGLPTVRRELAKNGNPPPEFKIQPTYVGAIVRAVL
jgi:ATP-dependent DNA helicase RecG